MIGILLAIIGALFAGLSMVLVKKRLDESSPQRVAFFNVSVNTAIFLPLALLLTDFSKVNIEAVLFLIVAGLLTPGISQLLFFKGIDKVGPSVNASIIATFPLYSTVLAVFLLNEHLQTVNWIGVPLIVIGVILIGRFSINHKNQHKIFSKKDLLIPIGASITSGSSYVIRKYALNLYNEPLLAVAIGFTVAFPIYFLMVLSSDTEKPLSLLKVDFRLFGKASIGFALAWIITFYALSLERVAIISTVRQIDSLFVIIFSFFLIRKMEHITYKLVISAIVIVSGVILIGI